MRGRIAEQTDVVGRPHDASAEVMLPETVHHDARGEPVVGGGDPVGEGQPSARGLRTGSGWRDDRHAAADDRLKRRGDFVARRLRVASFEEERLGRIRPDLGDAQRVVGFDFGSLQILKLLRGGLVFIKASLSQHTRPALLDEFVEVALLAATVADRLALFGCGRQVTLLEAGAIPLHHQALRAGRALEVVEPNRNAALLECRLRHFRAAGPVNAVMFDDHFAIDRQPRTVVRVEFKNIRPVSGNLQRPGEDEAE